jgi:ubiquinone/menaquinone biosynthesis C-methylase UbiE
MGWGASIITTNLLIGIDICPQAIERAKSLYPEIRFEVGNMLNTSFPSDYADCIICCEGYEHVARKDQFKLMREIHRVLRNRGIALLTVPIAKYVGDHTGNEFHLYEPTFGEVQETLKGGFEIIEFTKPNVARYVLEVIK